MRLSPVLLAVVTVSAAAVASPLRAAEVSAAPPSIASIAVPSLDPTAIGSAVVPAVSSPEAITPEFAQVPDEPAPDESAPEEPVPEQPVLDDAQPTELLPDSPADPAAPPAGTQTPLEETPNELLFDVTPGNEPTIELPESPPTAPPTEAAPTPPADPAPPTAPAPPAAPETPPEAAEPEPRVLVAEVVVSGTEDAELQSRVYDAIETRPGRTTTRSQLQEDINAVFATGFFANVRAVPEDTALGVRVTFQVEPNPVLQRVQVQGNQVLPQTVVDEIFAGQYGAILNLNQFQRGIESVNTWYQENGYVLAQVIGAPSVAPDGTVTLEVAEGVIEDIQVRFLDEDGEATDEEGNPIEGRTREFIITREFETQPGDVFNQNQVQADLQRVFGLGIFDDVRVSLDPGQDPRQVDVIVNVTESSTGSIAAGVGVSSASGLFGTVSYQQRNLGGNNQRLGAEVQLGQRDFLFDINFTDPWIAGDPYRTSYTVNAFRRESISLIFDGGEDEVELDNGDRPRVNRLGGGVSFSRPLTNWLGLAGWRASLGLQYQNIRITDGDGDTVTEDEEGNPLSFSGSGVDDLLTVQLAAVSDRRDSVTQPTRGSLLRFSTEQSIPVGNGNIFLNRLRASYTQYIPVDFTNFTEGPEALAFNVQAGTVLGDLPPYEAFSLGGTDSVRGYDAGEVGSGRSFVQASAEYRFPIFAIIGGAFFVDFGSDLGTGDNVPGNPAGARDKPGTGFGYGLGLRVQSPIGAIRVDYGINDNGDGQLHFGINERF